ncbi:hypothetical protein [Microbacterium sp. GXF0217]
MATDPDHQRELQARHRYRSFVHLIAYLAAHPCADCGESDPVVLDFDHLPGFTKSFEIGRAVGGSTRSWKLIRQEIDKCEVVCANCHRRRGARRANHLNYRLSAGSLSAPTMTTDDRRRRVPHGGGARVRHGCPCDACRERRREYAQARRAAQAERLNNERDVGRLMDDPQ